MGWGHVTQLIDAVARHRRIVGFDVVELSPNEGPHACAYTAAKLVYKLIGSALTRNAPVEHQTVGAVREPSAITNPSEPIPLGQG